MRRYIDAELMEPFVKREEWDTPDERWRPESEFGRYIDAIPTADVVEVVRCGECIHWNAETKGCKRNPSVYRWYAKDFCSNGVR